jgi:hypothetical protein
MDPDRKSVYFRPNGLNRHIENLPSNNSKTHIHLTHGLFSKADHMLVHKTNVNNLRKSKIISSVFSNHNGMKLELCKKKNFRKSTNIWNF